MGKLENCCVYATLENLLFTVTHIPYEGNKMIVKYDDGGVLCIICAMYTVIKT